MYQLTNEQDHVQRGNSYIPFDPANTDYQQFKTDVLGGAELQDADGNVMSQEQAEAFIKELP